MSKKVLIWILTLVFALIICGTATAADWTVGPGGTYDYTTIQSAIDSGTTLAGDTITVYDDSGNPYTYQENVLINKDLTVTTNGQVTVSGSLNPNTPVFTINSAGSQATLSGFTITSATNSAGVLINGATDIILNDLTITSCQRGVVTQGTTSNININGATISGTTSNGIYIDSGTTMSLSILNSVISGTGSHGVGKSLNANLDGLTVFNTSVSGSTGYGIYLLDYSGSSYLKNVVIDDVTVSGATSDGIRITMDDTRSGNVTISDSSVSNCNQHGFYLSTRGTLSLSNNTFTHDGYNGGTGGDGQFYGLYLVGTNNSVVSLSSDNGFNQNRNGVYLQNVGAEASPIVFNGSLFVDNAGYPFYIYGGRYITIQGGNFDDVSTQASTGYRINRAFYLLGNNDSIIIDGVTVNHTSSSAIFVDSGTSTGLSILNSVVSGTGSFGIFKSLNANLDGLTVFNTFVSGSTGYGIYLLDYSGSTYLKNVVIDDVIVSGATSDGIRITMDDTRSGNVTISDSSVSNCNQHGFYLSTRGTLTLSNNTFTHDGYNGGTGGDGQFYGLYLVGTNNSVVSLSSDNGFNQNRNGVYLMNLGTVSNPIVFNGSLFVDNAGYPFYIYGGRYITIQGGNFDDVSTQASTGYRINRAFYLLGNNDSITIDGVTVNHTSSSAIFVDSGTSTGLSILNSVVSGTGSHGIFKSLNANLDGLNVFNTSVSGSTGYGIYLLDYSGSSYLKNVVIDDVTVSGATSDGIRITMDDTRSENVTITDSTINNNTQNGIYLQARGTVKVKNNNIHNNTGTGLQLYSSTTEIYGNDIANNGVGLQINAGSNNNNVLNNNFVSNTVQARNYGTNNSFYDDKPIGGNYWSDYTGVDVDRDGFGDTPYNITGITDNYPYIDIIIHVYPGESIQTAINNSLSGYVIIVHEDNGNPATYTENLTIDKQLVIKTIDEGTVTVQAANTGSPVLTINNSGSLTTITGFTITGATGSAGVLIYSANYLNLTKLTIENCQNGVFIRGNSNQITLDELIINSTSQQGIFLEDGYGILSDITISNSQITNSVGTGIEKGYNARINGLSILNTIITNPGPYGLLLTGDGEPITDIVVDNVTVTQADNAGIWIPMGHPESHNIQITNTSSSNNSGNGLTITGRGIINITSNSFNNNTGWGVSLRGYDNPSVNFQNNIITNNGNGLYVRDVSGLVLSDSTNNIHDNGGVVYQLENADSTTIENTSFNNSVRAYTHAVLANNCDNLILRNLNINNSGSVSILLRGNGANTLIDQVVITGSGAQGILLEDGYGMSNITISNSQITNSVGTGIEKGYNARINGLSILNTIITNPGPYGLLLTGDGEPITDIVIDNVTVTQADNAGIWIPMGHPESHNIQITNTNSSDNGGNGLTIVGRGIINITSNSFNNNTGWGVSLRGYDNPTVTFNNNLISNNGNGLRLQGINGGNFQDDHLINNVGDDLYATSDTNNTFTRLKLGLAHPTVVTFDYINGIIMNGVESPPADILGLLNIGKYVDMQGLGSTSVNLKVYYSLADINGLNEASLKIFRYNTAWSVLSSPNGVNTTERYVYADGITSFSTFAAMGGPVDTIYVDGVNGNESNDGFTPLTAKLTINAGIGAASNNWSVNVFPNTTYNENVLVNKDITLQPYGVGNVALNGSITINTAGSGTTITEFNINPPSGSAITINSANNIEITNTTINNGSVVFTGACNNIILDTLTINNSGTDSIHFTGYGNYQNIQINNTQIDNSGGNAIGTTYYTLTLNNLTVSNITITNPTGFGIYLNDGNGVQIQNITIDNTQIIGAHQTGILITMDQEPTSQNVSINNSSVDGCGGDGVYIVARGIINITNNNHSFKNNAGWGLFLVGVGDTTTTFDNNRITNNGNGVHLENVHDITLTDTAEDNGGISYDLLSTNNITIADAILTNNLRNYENAVVMRGICQNITLNNLNINNSLAGSIHFGGGGNYQNILINNTSITNSGGTAIGTSYYTLTINNLTVSNTTITNPTGFGIYLDDGNGVQIQNITIDNTQIIGAHQTGIFVTMNEDPTSQNVTINNCTVDGCLSDGVYVVGKGTISITNNSNGFKNNTGWGLFLVGVGAATTTFNNNQITNNANGLYLQGVSGVNFQDNQLINNTGDDLYATGDTSNTFTRLTVGLAHPTTVSFDYINGIIINGVESPPADIPGLLNIGKYVDMQGFASTSVNLKVYYSPADITGLNEASLKIFRYTTAWSVLPSPNGVNTTERYVYADGITSFSTFAAMGGPADNVYVDGMNGSDSNDGFTPLTAKLAINAGIGAASNNWTVNVYPNTSYTEDALVNKDITLQPYGVGSVALNGSITVNIGGSGSTIQGFTVTGSSSAGISLESADNCLITNNTLSGNFMGIYLQNSDNNTISGNIVQNNGWVGICIDNSSNNVVNGGNNINGNVEGVFIVNNSNGNTITSNNIHHNTDTGITILNGPTGNIITGNTAISNNNVIGILIRNADINIISGNIIQSNGWAGISLDQADGNIINGENSISGNQEGINITNTSSGNTITGNSVTGNTNIGISVINGSNGNFFTGNTTISGNGIIGVYLRDSGSNTISDNTIENNSWVGVCLDNASGNVIDGDNDVNDNLEGLYIVNNSNNNIITGNNIHNNQDTGIYIDGSTGNQINSNTAISSNGVIGILFRNADGNFISANTIANNSFAGVALDNADDNIVNGGNIISGSSMGLYGVNNSSSNTVYNNTLLYNIWAGIVLDYTTDNTIYQNNFISNPLQALAQNGSGNMFYQGTVGNYWSDWPSTQPRLIDGNEFLYDEYPSTSPY